LLIIVDTLNGFARGNGMLVSPLVEAIIPNVVFYVEEAGKNKKCLRIFVNDAHDKDSVEFKRFGGKPHCLRGTVEAQLVDELIPYEEDAIVFEKNSTSFMFAKNPNFKYGFMEMLDKLINLKRVKVCGCCTDICDTNGVLPMMNYFDEDNRDIEVELLEDAIATYDAPWHDKDKYTEAAYLLLEQQGAKRVKKLGGK
ncbi:MAG: cysteine hydrolase, partial [Bacilli bacterium]|nr:cysteine hydrolase [Bacilli bacterium]